MKPLLVANWKMHKTLAESVAYVQQAGELLHHIDAVEIVLCPPYISLALMEGLLQGTRVRLGAQNVSSWKDGAYTGEISATMLAGHVSHAIVGHSERRKYFSETLEQINEKIERLAAVNIQPIVCVSNEEELNSLAELKDKVESWVVAFEPLEAIGSGKPEDPEAVEIFAQKIRKLLGKQTRVLYGGSVDEKNIGRYMAVSDGALVGGASLDPKQFVILCEAVGR
jgi:triosephosphate isomerase